MNHQTPDGESMTVARANRLKVAAFDYTLSAPKSVSLMFAFGDDHIRTAVIEAHHQAVTAALEYMETEASQTRMVDPLPRRRRTPPHQDPHRRNRRLRRRGVRPLHLPSQRPPSPHPRRRDQPGVCRRRLAGDRRQTLLRPRQSRRHHLPDRPPQRTHRTARRQLETGRQRHGRHRRHHRRTHPPLLHPPQRDRRRRRTLSRPTRRRPPPSGLADLHPRNPPSQDPSERQHQDHHQDARLRHRRVDRRPLAATSRRRPPRRRLRRPPSRPLTPTDRPTRHRTDSPQPPTPSPPPSPTPNPSSPAATSPPSSPPTTPTAPPPTNSTKPSTPSSTRSNRSGELRTILPTNHHELTLPAGIRLTDEELDLLTDDDSHGWIQHTSHLRFRALPGEPRYTTQTQLDNEQTIIDATHQPYDYRVDRQLLENAIAARNLDTEQAQAISKTN